ncbi:related to allantoate permease [Serendipita indica DSM 11827]|uniref:Related to allantoate permease n=1 Tax=Serendipita indica (strain DSM 11827) TaxID=1109443 RepID=G4TD69_SERID|nr:related to allantoate permease [Serendipita indica DSM 11827]
MSIRSQSPTGSVTEKKDVVKHLERTTVTEFVVPDADYDTNASAGFWGRFLKKSPSPRFLEDLQRMNETELDEVKIQKIERKLDWLIIPALAICYAFYYIDKTTLAYAAIFGIKTDLHLRKTEYSWLSSLFYFGWLFWALPGNLLMQKFPLNKYLAIFIWGGLLMAQAASRNFTELAILRTLSGAAEAIADPAFMLISSTWWTRAQQPRVIGLWYCANGGGIGLGGLLGYAIGSIKGGLASWKYEFLIIGALCCLWSIVLFIFIPDSPYTTHWFTREERLIIVSRKRHDQHVADARKWDKGQILEAFMDIKIYLFFFFGLTANIPNGGTSNFGTLIVKGFGFDTLTTTLMQIPYGAVIVLFILVTIFVNNRLPLGNRTWLMVATNIPTVAGFAMVAWGKNTATRLAGFWMTGASNATFVVGLSLVSGNVGGTTKKAIASAAVFLGVAAGQVEAPVYLTGVIACMVSRAAEIVVIILLRVVFVTSNNRRDKALASGQIEYDPRHIPLDDVSDWKNPAFRYVTLGAPKDV